MVDSHVTSVAREYRDDLLETTVVLDALALCHGHGSYLPYQETSTPVSTDVELRTDASVLNRPTSRSGVMFSRFSSSCANDSGWYTRGNQLPTAKAIEIAAFVDADSIDPVRISDSYYLAADGQVAAKPYASLRKALERSSKVAVANFAWHGRERLALLRVREEAIGLHSMKWRAARRGGRVRRQGCKRVRSRGLPASRKCGWLPACVATPRRYG